MNALLQDPEFWVGIGTLIFLGIVLWQKVPATIARSLDARANAITKELEESRRLREEAEQMLAQYREKRAGAVQEAEAIVTEAKAEAARYAAEARAAMAARIERRSRQAEEKIAQAEAQALTDMRALATDAAIAAAETLIAARLDDRRAADLVKRSLEEIPSKLN
jgi:F-type H+-transporting ATPase subunit b